MHRGSVDALAFDNRFTRELPADPDTSNVPRQVLGACFSRVAPKRVAEPRYVAHAAEVATLLDLGDDACRSDAFAAVFTGDRVLAGMDTHAMCYGGHQFGHWAGQLGDGRAINLGEVADSEGELQMLQLKGAGPTPYSRSADGLAVLRSSVREFLCSEAMFHLGVPTTRALSLTLTGEDVMRDMFYDGHPELEPGAVVCRVAPSFLRFGSYEILAATGQLELLRQLVDFTIRAHFAELASTDHLDADVYVHWFAEICRRTAAMVVDWQRVGFVHGVMNTDNMSILGLTIDYGPYGWLEDYDPDWTPNTTDAMHRRYRFGQQGRIAQWNLAQLANAIVPLVDDVSRLQDTLDGFGTTFTDGWRKMMLGKLGLSSPADTDTALVDGLVEILQLAETDMTVFFRRLASVDLEVDERVPMLHDAFYSPEALSEGHRTQIENWLTRYAARIAAEHISSEERAARMNSVNPKFVLRNYIAQLAIDRAASGDFARIHELLDVLRHPYDEQPEREEHAAKRPDWARDRPGCSMLSCSS